VEDLFVHENTKEVLYMIQFFLKSKVSVNS